MVWSSAKNGWGPVERNMSNGENAAGDGRPMSIGGHGYEKGLGVNPYSEITFPLAGKCTAFSADVGVDDEVGTAGSVVFQVWADQTMLLETPVLRGGAAPLTVNVNLTGRTTLRLIVMDGGDGGWNDHADWANPTLTCR
jgi:hypothetical protein